MKLNQIILLEYQREVTEKSYRTSLLKKYRSSSDNEKDLSDDEVIDKVFSVLEESDPTSNKIYVAWLAREYTRDNIHLLEDLTSTAGSRLVKYEKYKRKKDFPSSIKDILKLDFNQFVDGIDSYEIPEDTKASAKEFDHVWNDKDIDIYIPLTWEASVKLGRNTHWCTAADSVDGKENYEHYSDDGPLYVIIPKKPKYEHEKYQLQFETDQFMDREDKRVKLSDLCTKYNGLVDFIEKIGKTNEVIKLDKNFLWLVKDRNKFKIGLHELYHSNNFKKLLALETDEADEIIVQHNI